VATLRGSYRLATTGGPHFSFSRSCQSNLKQVALALTQYQYDYDERYPAVAISPTSPYGWADAIQPYLKDTRLLQCPKELFDSSQNPYGRDYTDYWYNRNLSAVKSERLEVFSLILLAGEGNDGVDLNDARYSKANLPLAWLRDQSKPCWRHVDGASYVFVDGHVKHLRPEEVTTGSVATNRATFALE
jgi:prepilin-type processing-associated H-X9-DG protein